MVVKKLISLVLFCMATLFMYALTVNSGVNRNTLSMADQLVYTVKITDSAAIKNIAEPAPPQIPLFTYRNMTSGSSSSFSFGSGQAASVYSITYEYHYTPQKTGTTTINPISINIKNRIYRTQSHQVTVVQGPKTKSGQSAPAFPFPFSREEFDPWGEPESMGQNTMLVALPEQQHVFHGYPAIVSYYLYTDEIVRSFNLEEERDHPGYGKTTYEQPSQLNYEDVRYQGRNYKRALIKRLAIIPNRDGQLLAPQLEGIARLYSFGYMNKKVSSTGGRIEVRPVPRESAPAGFSGAVGNFEISSSLSKKQISLGEAITLTVKITGRGNFNQFTAPNFKPGTGFQISKPMVVDNLTAGIEGTRICYFTLIPQTKGELSLPELEFVWFAHDKASFNTWKLPPTVVKISGAHVLSYLNRMLEPGTPRTMYPRILKQRYAPYRAVVSTWWYWLLLVFTVASGVGISLWVASRKQKRLHPLRFARRNADKILQRYMKQATQAAQELSLDFYPQAESALWNYLDTKYKLPNRLSTQEKLTHLQEYGFSETLLESMDKFFEHCTSARFMPGSELAVSIGSDLELLRDIVLKINQRSRIGNSGANDEA